MRRTLPLLIALVTLAACGGSSSDSDSTETTTENTSAATATTTATEDSTASGSEDTDGDATTVPANSTPVAATPVSLAPREPIELPADCAAQGNTTATTVAPPEFPEGKPEVELPAQAPTELVVTNLIEGEGPEAQAGDIVEVNYVGVLSEDGTEFDNSYDRGATLPVTLGTGAVIPGWDQGLLGAKAGDRLQLDIPAELAYGENPPSGGVIGAGAALSFVVDVVSVSSGPPATDPAQAPDIEFPELAAEPEWGYEDLTVGDECEIAQPGDTVYVNLQLVEAETGTVIQSSWEAGRSFEIPLTDEVIPGLVDGIIGMGVGGERLITLTPESAFGAAGNTQQGLDPDAVLYVFVELVEVL